MKAKSPAALFLLTALVLVSSFVTTASAQTHRGTIRGTVYDPNRAVIVGATVKLTNSDTNETREVTSGAEGEYAISSLPPGTYWLEATSTGFSTYKEPVVLRVNEERRVDVPLGVRSGDVIEVDITASNDAALKKDSASLGTVIENRQVEGLPLDGRNFFELSLLVPGAAPNAPGSAGSVRGDFAFSVNGAREDSNNFLLDGVYNVDPKLNTFGVRPPVDAIREFETLTSTYDAAFGRSAGAQVNVVLKSGTNDFRGSLYEFHRNGALDARNFFAPATRACAQVHPQPVRRQPRRPRQERHDLLLRRLRGHALARGADARGERADARGARGRLLAELLRRARSTRSRASPSRGAASRKNVSTPSAAASPRSTLCRTARRPSPTSSPRPRSATATTASTRASITSSASARRSPSATASATARLFEPFAGPTFAAVPGYGNDVTRRSQNAMVGETHVFSPRFVNDLRAAFNRVATAVRQEGAGTSINRAVGLQDLATNPRDFGLSFITVTGFSPLGHEGNNPQNSVTNTYQVLDTATYTRGQHLFKFGGDVRFVQQNAFRDVEVARAHPVLALRADHRQRARRPAARPPAPDRRRARR